MSVEENATSPFLHSRAGLRSYMPPPALVRTGATTASVPPRFTLSHFALLSCILISTTSSGARRILYRRYHSTHTHAHSRWARGNEMVRCRPVGQRRKKRDRVRGERRLESFLQQRRRGRRASFSTSRPQRSVVVVGRAREGFEHCRATCCHLLLPLLLPTFVRRPKRAS